MTWSPSSKRRYEPVSSSYVDNSTPIRSLHHDPYRKSWPGSTSRLPDSTSREAEPNPYRDGGTFQQPSGTNRLSPHPLLRRPTPTLSTGADEVPPRHWSAEKEPLDSRAQRCRSNPTDAVAAIRVRSSAHHRHTEAFNKVNPRWVCPPTAAASRRDSFHPSSDGSDAFAAAPLHRKPRAARTGGAANRWWEGAAFFPNESSDRSETKGSEPRSTGSAQTTKPSRSREQTKARERVFEPKRGGAATKPLSGTQASFTPSYLFPDSLPAAARRTPVQPDTPSYPLASFPSEDALRGEQHTRMQSTMRSITSLSTAPHVPVPSHSPPSPLLQAVVNSVACSRDAEAPAIPPEVIIAFDEYIGDGSSMMHFQSHGNPVKRFFAVKFINLYEVNDELLPEVVFGWKEGRSESKMSNYFLLADLMEVSAKTRDHTYVQRFRVDTPGQLQFSAFLRKHTMKDDCIFRLTFGDSQGGEEQNEDLLLKAPNLILYYSWLVFTDFISTIGHLN